MIGRLIAAMRQSSLLAFMLKSEDHVWTACHQHCGMHCWCVHETAESICSGCLLFLCSSSCNSGASKQEEGSGHSTAWPCFDTPGRALSQPCRHKKVLSLSLSLSLSRHTYTQYSGRASSLSRCCCRLLPARRYQQTGPCLDGPRVNPQAPA